MEIVFLIPATLLSALCIPQTDMYYSHQNLSIRRCIRPEYLIVTDCVCMVSMYGISLHTEGLGHARIGPLISICMHAERKEKKLSLVSFTCSIRRARRVSPANVAVCILPSLKAASPHFGLVFGSLSFPLCLFDSERFAWMHAIYGCIWRFDQWWPRHRWRSELLILSLVRTWAL